MWQIMNAFASCLVSIIGVIMFGKITLMESKKISKLKLLIILIISNIIYTYAFTSVASSIKTIIMLIINIILYKTIFKLSIPKSIVLGIIHIIIVIIPDILYLFIVTKVIGISKEVYYSSIAGSIISNIIVVLLLIIISYILRKPLNKLLNYKIESNNILIILSILTFLCITIFIYLFSNAYKNNQNYIEYLFVSIVFIIILYSLVLQVIKNIKLTKEYDNLLEFMKTYEEEIENQRILRHETKNEFLNIKGQLTDDQNKEKIIEYIDNILGDKYKIKYEEYAKFNYLPANGIKGLCYFKTHEARNKKIKVSVNISKSIMKSPIYDLDIKQQRNFAKILGVYLDNAIEACNTSKKKELGIEAYSFDDGFEMIISNTFDNKLNKKIGIEKYSTKGINRGHGLLLVKNILSHNKMFDVKTEVNNNLYIQYIRIKNSHK